VNAVEALDDYLVELLAEAAPPPAPATVDFTADLLAEMDADPAFAGSPPVGATPGGPGPSVATSGQPAVAAEAAPTKVDFTADLLAEMDADPAFACSAPVGATPGGLGPSVATSGQPAVAAEAAPTKVDFTADLLAEMDADPAFADTPPVGATPGGLGPSVAISKHSAVAAEAAPTKVDFTADLLAEMDADPAFAGAAATTALPAAPTAKPAAKPNALPIARRPAPRTSRLPANIQALFQPAQQVADSHRRAADRSTRWLRLRCGGQTYALELLKVQEVVLPVPLLPLRGAARSFLGIMNLRGQVVPVLDLGIHLGAGPVDQDAQTRVVVLEENGETMGLRVSAVDDVASLTDQQIEPPDNTRLCRISNHLFRGVARIGAQPVILLDATQLLH